MIFLLIGATLTVFVRDSWPLYSFCMAVLLVLAAIAAKRQSDQVSLLPLLIPAFGVLQLVLSTSAYAPATRVAALRWFALAAVMLIAEMRLCDKRDRDRFLDQFVLFAAVMATLCLVQLHTSHGKVLWYFDSGYTDFVYGFFPSRNNYGQFVELALAVALARALTDRSQAGWFAVASGLLYASAIASTSRGAMILTTIEVVVVPAVVMIRTRTSVDWRRATWLCAGICAVAVVWTAATGWDAAWKRFNEPDPYQSRREFTQSALRMAVEHPLLGTGLGTFPLIYPKYATIDTPEQVNHAHDDWVEFASDGGFLFAALIFGLFATAAPQMWKHPWCLGLLFVIVHAGFDYPFPRLAISGWMFALLGAVRAAHRGAKDTATRDPRWIRRAVLASLCLLGIHQAGRLGLADLYAKADTTASVRKAIGLVPDDARHYLRLAQLYESNASLLIEHALTLNPHDSQSWIGAGLNAESGNDFKTAEADLRRAAELDSTWTPRWTLANYYFRRSDASAFWTWAAKAMSNASDRRDFQPLFRLGASIDPMPEQMLHILPERPAPLRHYVSFLLQSGQIRGLEEAASRLLACGVQGNDRPYVLWSIEGFLSHREPDGAVRLWSKLEQRGWIRRNTGTAFADRPLESSLDWRYKDVDGVTRSLSSDGRLRFEFSGQQPEETRLLERYVPVRPGVRERFEWRSQIVGQTAGDQRELGVRWEIESLGGKILASSPLEPGRAEAQDGFMEFTPEESIVRIQFLYKRAPGMRRTAGAVDLMPARVVASSGTEAAALLLNNRQ